MSKPPAFQFYTGDYVKDPELSMCSPATRGIWIDFLCAAHESARSGQIAGTPEQFARICRCTAAEFVAAVNELQTTRAADVRERNGVYTVTNRRMKRDADSRERERLKKQRQRNGGDSVNVPTRPPNIPSPQSPVSAEDEGAGGSSPPNVPLSSSSSTSPSGKTKPSSEGLEQPPAAVAAGTPPAAKRKSPKPRDERVDHWAIQTICALTNQFPRKIIWDEIIGTLGAEPQVERLTECFRAWSKVSNNAANSVWFLDWFVNGIPQVNGQRARGQPVNGANGHHSGALDWIAPKLALFGRLLAKTNSVEKRTALLAAKQYLEGANVTPQGYEPYRDELLKLEIDA